MNLGYSLGVAKRILRGLEADSRLLLVTIRVELGGLLVLAAAALSHIGYRIHILPGSAFNRITMTEGG